MNLRKRAAALLLTGLAAWTAAGCGQGSAGMTEAELMQGLEETAALQEKIQDLDRGWETDTEGEEEEEGLGALGAVFDGSQDVLRVPYLSCVVLDGAGHEKVSYQFLDSHGEVLHDMELEDGSFSVWRPQEYFSWGEDARITAVIGTTDGERTSSVTKDVLLILEERG